MVLVCISRADGFGGYVNFCCLTIVILEVRLPSPVVVVMLSGLLT